MADRTKRTLHIRAKFAAYVLIVAGGVLLNLASFRLATAQTVSADGVLADGNAALTGFSGVQLPTLIRPGTDPAERATIDPNGPVLRVIDLQAPGAAPQAQVLAAAKPFTITAGQIGQVFAVALDNASPPNIYAAATSTYGLPIVVPDQDGDGRPDRAEEGVANARFMAGLFGPAAQRGGPGSIWRIDGTTGEVRLFANVTLGGPPNSGPALGGLAFDAASNSLFVADRETGMIHRFDMTGAERGRYDHGTQGRRAAGLAAVPFNPSTRLVITRPPFQPANPETWGYASPQRRIFGLTAREGRLYYAVAENLQIWSVAIVPDGAFETDARIEFSVPPGASASEISKIAFDDRGRMLLAERVAPTGAFDFAALTEEGGGRVLRYAPSAAGPGWQPVAEEYALGFSAPLRGGNGGVAVGYGYDATGRLDRNSCNGFMWATGEQLRVSPDAAQAAQLAQGGPANLNGLQGLGIDVVRPVGTAQQGYFVDYNDRIDDAKARGHLGDVAVFRACTRPVIAQLPPAMPGPPALGAAVPAPGVPGGFGVGPGPDPGPIGKPDLALSKAIQAGPTVPAGVAVPNACVPTATCWFRVTVTNNGPGAFSGPLNVTDTMPAGWTFVSAAAPWACHAAGAAVACTRAAMTLVQGQSTTLDIQLQPSAPPGGQPVFVENCAELNWKGGAGDVNKGNDRACHKLVLTVAPAVAGNFDLTIAKKGPAKCVAGQPCNFNVTVQNLGTGNYQGVLSVEDVSTPGLTFSGSPTTHWTCVTAAAGTVKCNYGQASIPSGAGSTLGMLILNFTVPANLPAGTTQIKNCVKVVYSGKSAVNAHPDEHCITIAVEPAPAATGNFDLTIAKKGPAKCVAGQPCVFNVTVQNLGTGNYQGPISVEDVSTPGLTLSGSPMPHWTCVAGAAGTVKCNYGQASIPSGMGSTFGMLILNFTVPANLPAGTTQIKNCVKVVYSGTSAVNTHPDEHCVTIAVEQPPGAGQQTGDVTLVPGTPGAPGTPGGPITGAGGVAGVPGVGQSAQDLNLKFGGIKVSKTGPASGVCEPGKTCDFTISIRGVTSVPCTDVFEVADVPPPGWTFAEGKNWTCPSPTNCTYDVTKHSQWPNIAKSGLTATGTWLQTNITFKVPDNAKEGMVENCVNATLPPAPGQTGKTIEVACAKVWVGHAPKLTVTKEFDTSSCAPGEECSYTVTVKNEGKGAYTGFLDLRDSGGSPYGLGIDSVDGKDWKCSIFSDSFTCNKLSLKVGESVSIRVKAKIKKDMNTALFNEISNCAILHVYDTDPKKLTEGQKQYLVRDFLRFNGYDLSTVTTAPGVTTKKSPYGEGALSEAEKKMLADYNSKHGNPDMSGEITDDLIKSLLPQVANETSFPGDCATIKVREPGVAIRKVMVRSADVPADVPTTGPKAAKCAVGDVCVWEIEVYGTEAAPYTKPIKIEEALPNGFDLVDYKPRGSGGWSCSGSPYKLICTHPPANVTHSASLKLQIYARMSNTSKLTVYGDPRHPWVKNCVKIIYDDLKKYQEQQEPDKPWQACDKERISSGWDTNHYDYDATGSGPCLPPKCSFYEFTITGRDNIARGPLTQRITPPPGSAFPQARVTRAPALCPASGWSCSKSGGPDGPFTCNIANCTLRPGEQVTVRLEGNVAPDLKEPPPAPIDKTACGVLEYETGAFDTGIEQLASKRTKQACATITVMARLPACPAGYVKTADGQCCLASQMTTQGVCCPPGQNPDARRLTCVPAKTPNVPTFVPPPTPAACPPGTLRTRSGECCPRSQMTTRGVCCPSGQKPDSRRRLCVPVATTPPPTPQCTGGKVLVGNSCVCPPGTTEQRGVCVRPPPPPPPQCTGGKVLVGNNCVCPAGTIEQRGVCVRAAPPPPQCTGGKVRVGNSCVCPPGTQEMRGLCAPIRPTPQPSPATPSQIQPMMIPGARVICPAGEVWSEPNKKCLPRLR